MYNFLLGFHNLLRWVVLLLAVFALVRAYLGWLGKRAWTRTDRQAGMFFSIGMDIQLLVGLLLFFLFSPIMRATLTNISAAMTNPEQSYFTVEHAIPMLVAVILVHVGSAVSRRAADDLAKHRAAAMWYTIAALIVVVSIPWWRPLLRL